MHPVYEDHIALTEPPEMQDLLHRAHDLFDQYGLEAAHQAFDDLLSSADGVAGTDNTASNNAGHALTLEFINQLLQLHHIRLNEDATLANRVEVLEFIKVLDTTEILEPLMWALKCDEFDNCDKFARCMLEACDIAEEDSLLYLEEVPDAVINTMLTFIEKRIEFEVVIEPMDEGAKTVFREFDKFSRACGGAEMRSHKYLFEEDGVPCMDFDFYFKANREYLLGLSVDDMVLECIGFAIMSDDGFNNPTAVIMQSLQEYVGDLNKLTGIHMKLQLTLNQYRNEISSGVTMVS